LPSYHHHHHHYQQQQQQQQQQQYASVEWSSITFSDASKLKCIQQQFVLLCYCFFSHLDHSYGNVLNYLKLHTLNEGQWEDRKQWSLGVGQRRKVF